MPKLLTGHMPQLDALRTIAVLFVISQHWFPYGEGLNVLPTGTIGVMIFFVLSGFLITRILLNSRESIASQRTTVGNVYRLFLIRRILRIFPLYYLVITFVLIFLPQDSDIRQHPLYYYLYGYNILLHQTGNWSDVLSPFWTLGVEEQLYLVWPFIVLFTPRSSFRWLLPGMILLGIAFRGYGYAQGDLDGVLTPASFDAFGLGAFWAFIVTNQPDSIPDFLRRLTIIATLAIVAFLGMLFLPANHVLVALFQRTLISILSLYIIANACFGYTGVAGVVLNNKALQYIGRISYGIYVFHMLVPGYAVPFIMRMANRFLGITVTLGFWSHRLFSLLVLISLASLSWFLFEKPISELKRHFSYKA